MSITRLALALIAGCSIASAAVAQEAPAGGPTAKGNAPVKQTHTVNDGAAKGGANSFTEGQARNHIAKSGYAGVSPLTKGPDGVWRGTASKGGVTRNVALDFKGNVTDGGPAGPGPAGEGRGGRAAGPAGQAGGPGADAGRDASAGAASEGDGAAGRPHGGMHRHGHRHHLPHHHHRHGGACARPGPRGVACSGIDRNRNGISDKEDHAIRRGARP